MEITSSSVDIHRIVILLDEVLKKNLRKWTDENNFFYCVRKLTYFY